jgi:hypothetical protein
MKIDMQPFLHKLMNELKAKNIEFHIKNMHKKSL